MKTHYRYLMTMVTMLAVLTACEHEISFDYPSAEPQLVFDGQISNEGVTIKISRTRQMNDSTKNHAVDNAQVWISSDGGDNELLVYDEQQHCYVSATGLVGEPGRQYTMRATVDGHDYEATSTMMQPAPIDTVFFRWMEVMNERIYFLSLRVIDAYPDERNYYWYRLMRGTEVFRWYCRSDRGSKPGFFEYDLLCSLEKDLDKDTDDNGERPLHNDDILQLEMMTVDRTTYEFFQSLKTNVRTAANPISNIRGGALGFFSAVNITRSAPVKFNKNEVQAQSQDGS